MSVPEAMPAWVKRAIIFWWTILAVGWLSYTVARELRSLLIQIVIALFLSFAIEPVVNRLEARGMRRGVATALTLFGGLVAAIVFLTAMGQLIATQVTDLVDALPGYLRSGQAWLDNQFGIEIDAGELIDRFQDSGGAAGYATDAADQLLSAGTTIVTLLFQFITVSLFTFYLAADGPRLRRTICSLLPPARQVDVLKVWELAIAKTGAYISSRFVLAVASALFHWVVFTVLGLPSAVALAIWVGIVSQFIPTLGTYLAGVLPILVALGIDPKKALWVLVAVVVYQQIENYLLQPRITAQTLDMHPAVSFAAVLAGTSLFGAPGALLALPVVATASGFFSAYFERHEVIANHLVDEHALHAKSGTRQRRANDREQDGDRDG